MTLTVPFDHFASELKALGASVAYVRFRGNSVIATSYLPGEGVCVIAKTPLPINSARKALSDQGLQVRDGEWIDSGHAVESEPVWIGAVSYKSEEARPGLWLNAFPFEPSHGEVLVSCMNEFVDQGLISEMTLEQFQGLFFPNVVIYSPDDMSQAVS